jgi:hypothetical protein
VYGGRTAFVMHVLKECTTIAATVVIEIDPKIFSVLTPSQTSPAIVCGASMSSVAQRVVSPEAPSPPRDEDRARLPRESEGPGGAFAEANDQTSLLRL